MSVLWAPIAGVTSSLKIILNVMNITDKVIVFSFHPLP